MSQTLSEIRSGQALAINGRAYIYHGMEVQGGKQCRIDFLVTDIGKPKRELVEGRGRLAGKMIEMVNTFTVTAYIARANTTVEAL